MQLTLTFLWALGVAAIMAAPRDGARAPVVMTRTGGVRGAAKTSSQGVPYFRYLGIPYAKPPTGSRRFSRPEPAEAWTGTRNARHFGASCPQPPSPFQPPVLMDEDCLFLNVFAPQSANSSSPLPVMVFVHGGGFYIGSSSNYDGEALCGKDVVVVTINYRLGALGFLSTGDAVAPGNYGLLDQLLALQWVRDNIAAFHGDPHKVTIFGESAGAASVSLLLLSPLSKGLFQGVIAESGSSLSPFAVAQSYSYPSQPAIAKDLASKVGCQPTDDHAALVACLRTKDAQTLATADVVKDVNAGVTWQPVVEREYGVLPQPPLTLLQQGRFLHVPVMSGTNHDEGTLYAAQVPNIQDGLPRYFFEVMVREFMFSRFGELAFGLAPRVLEVYTKGLNKSDPRDLRAAWAQLQTDWIFFVPSLGELLLLQSQDPQTPCFQYLFSRRPDATELPAWMGVPHGFELPYVFGAPFRGEGDFFSVSSNFTDVDRRVSDDVMTMWTNFAKYGNPTPKPVDGEPWPVFTAHSRAYLRIGSPLLLDTDLKHDVFQFWGQEVFNAVLGPSTPAPAQASRPTPPVLPVVG